MVLENFDDYNVILRSVCEEKLKEIYGNNVPEKCSKRLNGELELIKKEDLAQLLVSYCGAAHKAEPNKKTLNGFNVSDSYIVYLLGLSIFNPLDKESMDGHICSFEYARSEIKGFKGVDFCTTIDIQGRMTTALETEKGIDKVFMDYFNTRREDVSCYNVVQSGKAVNYENLPSLVFYRDKEMEFIDYMAYLTNTNPLSVPYNDKSVIDFITGKSECKIGQKGICFLEDEMYMGDIIKAVKPASFYQLSKAIGLYCSTGVWSYDIKREFLSGNMDIDSVFATRNDVFEYLVNEFKDSGKAYFLSEKVRRGDTRQNNEYKDCSRFKELQRIKYLPLRSLTLYYARLACTQAYYKINYPEAFYFAYFVNKAPKGFTEYTDEEKVMSKICCLYSDNQAANYVPYLETAAEMYNSGFVWNKVCSKFKSDNFIKH